MIYAVTVSLDVQTLDPTLPAKMLGAQDVQPGTAREIPGGVIVFQSGAISSEPGEPCLYRFVIQFGSRHAAGLVGNWLFNTLRGTAAALSLAGIPIPIDHHTIIAGLEQVA